MRVVELSLRNYRVFEELDLELPARVIGIFGENGAGKSSLMESIAFACYGVDAARTKKHDIRTHGVLTDCEVRMVFEHAGSPYEVRRTIKGRGHAPEAELFGGGMLLASGTTEVDAEIRRLLHMDVHVFRASVYAWRINGWEMWETPALGAAFSAPSVGDVDGDGRPEIVWTTEFAVRAHRPDLHPGVPGQAAKVVDARGRDERIDVRRLPLVDPLDPLETGLGRQGEFVHPACGRKRLQATVDGRQREPADETVQRRRAMVAQQPQAAGVPADPDQRENREGHSQKYVHERPARHHAIRPGPMPRPTSP